MRVLVLGGTGSIGEPVVRALIRARHQVWALARSGVAADGLASLGAEPLAGDLRAPAGWLHALPAVEAVIHAAGTFTDDEAEIDRRLLGSLLPHLSARSRPVRFIYTGGCWLYGISEHCALNEEAPFDPLEPYAWMIAHLRLVLGAPGLEAMVIHPAMVYEASGGVFARFLADARQRHAVRLVGAAQVSWPLVHRDDLADLYRRVLEAGAPGESYLGAAIEGLSVGRIAQAFARRFATPSLEPEVISADEIAAELGS